MGRTDKYFGPGLFLQGCGYDPVINHRSDGLFALLLLSIPEVLRLCNEFTSLPGVSLMRKSMRMKNFVALRG